MSRQLFLAVILRLPFYEFVIFLAFGGNCRKLSSKIGHNVFGKSKKSQTLRVPRVESRLFFRPLHASVKSRHCGFSDSIERKVPCTEEKDRDSTRGTRRVCEFFN